MSRVNPSDVSLKRVMAWVAEAKPLTEKPVWTERRLAIDFGGHTYIITNGQVFQCAHCGHYDPKWSVTEVLTYFSDVFGVKPYEIEVTCAVAADETDK